MARTADTVEDDARDLDVGPEVLEPATSAATDAPMPRTSTTSTTGRASDAARSAVLPLPSAAPSNRPVTPSTTASWPSTAVASVAAVNSGRIAQGSRL